MNDKIEKSCPKCGYDDTVLTFTPIGEKKHAEDKDLFAGFGTLENKDSQYPHATTLIIDEECIKVHCRTCQYAWVTASLDNKEREECEERDDNAFGLSIDQIQELADEFNEKMTPIFADMPRVGGKTDCDFDEVFGSFSSLFPNGFGSISVVK